MKHVILGSGAAGIKAAATIRQHCPTAEIVMVTMDEAIHSRCMLHLYISRERDVKGLDFTGQAFFELNRIQLLQGTVVNINPIGKKVSLKDGRTMDYDRLLIASGASSVTPPIGQLKTAANVYGLRHLSDARQIDALAEKTSRTVIIGSGLIGLDVAYALLHRGKHVTVVEMVDRILPLNLDARAAATYQQKFEEAGCVLRLASKVCDTVCDADNKIIKVVLEGGEELPCDMVVVAAGVKPAVEFLADSGIEYQRAVVVNDYLQTNAPEVYAAGDVNGLAGIWPNAAKQGEIAALNMCGIPTLYADKFAAKNTINFFGIPTLSVGVIEPVENDRVLVKECRTCYKKIILRDNYVAGVILQGDISGSGFWLHLIKNNVQLWGSETALWDLSYADYYQTDDRAQYLWCA